MKDKIFLKEMEKKLADVREKISDVSIDFINASYFLDLLKIEEHLAWLIDFLETNK